MKQKSGGSTLIDSSVTLDSTLSRTNLQPARSAAGNYNWCSQDSVKNPRLVFETACYSQISFMPPYPSLPLPHAPPPTHTSVSSVLLTPGANGYAFVFSGGTTCTSETYTQAKDRCEIRNMDLMVVRAQNQLDGL